MVLGARWAILVPSLIEDPVVHELPEPVGQPVAGDVPETDRVKMRDVPGAEQAACLIHKGPYDGLAAAYQTLWKWVEENGYRVSGPDREVYLAGCATTDDPNEYVTEIQVPVEKS